MDEKYNQRGANGAFESMVSDEDIWAYFEEDPSVKRCAEHFGYSRRQMRHRLAKIRESMGVVKEADPGRAAKLEQLIASVPLEGPGGSRIKSCTALYLLPGWENSPGAAVEIAFAKFSGIPSFESISDLLVFREGKNAA